MAKHDLKVSPPELHQPPARAVAREAQELTRWARRLLAPLRQCELVEGGAAPRLSSGVDHARAAGRPHGAVGAGRPRLASR